MPKSYRIGELYWYRVTRKDRILVSVSMILDEANIIMATGPPHYSCFTYHPSKMRKLTRFNQSRDFDLLNDKGQENWGRGRLRKLERTVRK